MKKTCTYIVAFLTSIICILPSGCGSGGGNTGDPHIGFFLLPNRFEVSQTTGSEISVPTLMRAQGEFIEPQGTIQGTLELFPFRDIGPAATQIPDAKVPAKWRITYFELPQPGRIPCQDGIRTVERNVHPGEVEPLSCTALVFPVAIIPNTVDTQNPPSTMDIDVEGASAEYGPPQVAILNEFGQLLAVAPATIIIAAKHKIRFTPPNMSQYPNGVYSVSVNNVTVSGQWDTVGVGEISVYGNTPPPAPNPPDPCSVPAPCLF